jgi:hypothetical protein
MVIHRSLVAGAGLRAENGSSACSAEDVTTSCFSRCLGVALDIAR